jgi:hypothetical protein
LIMPPSTKEGALNSWLSKQGVKCCTCLLILQTSIRLRTAGHGSKVAFVTARASLIVCETQWNMSWNFRLNSYGDCYIFRCHLITSSPWLSSLSNKLFRASIELNSPRAMYSLQECQTNSMILRSGL